MVITDRPLPEGYYGDRREMLQFVPEHAQTFLDVGCGEGAFGSLLKERFPCEVWGIELVPAAAEKAAKQLDRVIVGDIERDALELPQRYFDCVILNDVLEHLLYPERLLCRLRDTLKGDGYIVASIPNVRYFPVMKNLVINKQWEYVDAGVMDRTHLRFFTRKSITALFESCSYAIVTIQGINGWRSWKFELLNKVLLNLLSDMRHMQFACIAKK